MKPAPFGPERGNRATYYIKWYSALPCPRLLAETFSRGASQDSENENGARRDGHDFGQNRPRFKTKTQDRLKAKTGPEPDRPDKIP